MQPWQSTHTHLDMQMIKFLSLAIPFLMVLVQVQAQTPQIFFPGHISTELNERDLAISPSGDTMIFTCGSVDQSKRALFMTTRDRDDRWSQPSLLPFSGTHQDIEPFFHPSGGRLYFASKRPLPSDTLRTDYNIWSVPIEKDMWGLPVCLPSPINTTEDEFYPSVTLQGDIYFTAIREGGIGSEDIWFCKYDKGSYSEAMVLDSAVNSKTYEFNAYVSPNGNTLVFSSYGRQDGLGGGDLYISHKDDTGRWGQAENLGPNINSKYLDYCPFIDQKSNTLFFSSNRRSDSNIIKSYDVLKREASSILNGLGNIYKVDLDNQ